MHDAYLVAFSPFAIRFSESFGIRWYGLAYLAGFMAGYYTMRYFSWRRISPLSAQDAGDLIFATATGTIIGGRLGYCLLYSPELFLRFSSDFPFWGVLAIHEGGMASHGGIIGLIVGGYLFAKRRGFSALHCLDLTTLGGALGILFGRMANFINGELLGRPISSPIPWAVKFPQDMLLWPTQHPEHLVALSPVVSNVGVDPSVWERWMANPAWNLHFISETINRLIVAVQHGDDRIATIISPLLVARHPSQIYEGLLEGLLIFVVLALLWRTPKKVGFISAVFATLYAVVRIFGEQFRLPDPHIGYQLFGLTRGQWLSIGMLALAVIFCIKLWRRDAPQFGGWGV